jgi:FkbM family methyltransferase
LTGKQDPIIIKPHQAAHFISQFFTNNPFTIIEAGAFDGTDTRRLATQFPQATIHAFEPVPEIFKRLVANTQDLTNVRCYPVALSDTSGTATFHISEKPTKPGIPSQAGSLRAPKERLQCSPLIFPETITVPTTTLTEWAQEYNITTIDMLWLDMQGWELNVLKSIPQNLFKTIQVIHTEVAFIEAYEGQPTYLVVRKWLKEKGFMEVAHDFENTSNWFFGNSIMVRK